MIHITEDKLRAAIQICLGSDSIYTEGREAKLVHDIKALSVDDVAQMEEVQIKKKAREYMMAIDPEFKMTNRGNVYHAFKDGFKQGINQKTCSCSSIAHTYQNLEGKECCRGCGSPIS